MVEGDEDEESYASEFTNSTINDDVDDSGTKIEPESHKEHPEIVNDDDNQIEKEKKYEEIEKEKKDDDDDDVKKVDKGVKEKSNADVATGSTEFRKEKMQTPIPSPIRSHRKVSSSDKTITKELTGNVSPRPATTSKDSSTSKRKKRPISFRMKILPGSIDSMCRRHVIMEYLVKISKKARILKLKQRHLKITILTSYTPYPSRKIQRISACTSQETTKI
ncbi:hypothetical protein Tco_0506639 [Tanacetum coccineum]